jgi:hypothetical protein
VVLSLHSLPKLIISSFYLEVLHVFYLEIKNTLIVSLGSKNNYCFRARVELLFEGMSYPRMTNSIVNPTNNNMNSV